MRFPFLSLGTTSACNANCKHCTIKPWMDKVPGYHMSIEEVEDLIYYTKISGYEFDRIIVTGGEPLIWRNLLEGLKLIKNSGIADFIEIQSNVLHTDRMREVLDNVDMIRITEYNWNKDKISMLKEQFGASGKFSIIRHTSFWVPPDEPVPDSLPAYCHCEPYTFCNNQIQLCGTGQSIMIKHNIEGMEEFFDRPLKKDYLEELSKVQKGNIEICRYCISNSKVRKVCRMEEN